LGQYLIDAVTGRLGKKVAVQYDKEERTLEIIGIESGFLVHIRIKSPAGHGFRFGQLNLNIFSKQFELLSLCLITEKVRAFFARNVGFMLF
jgi:hypothetical protein